MSADPRPVCDYSDLHEDECEHCDPTPRIARPLTEREVSIQQLREEVTRAREAASLSVTYPLAIVEQNPWHPPKRSTPRWDPGNLMAQIGNDLTQIGEMFDGLHEEAETRHDDSEFPGGDALVMLVTGADVEAFGYVQISAMVGRISEADVVIPAKHDIQPPLSFLAGWTDIIREERGMETFLRATIPAEIKYIRDSLDWMFSLDENGDMRFLQVDDLADGLSKVRRRLEDILKDGTRAEFTRVHCISSDCEQHPRLMKLWAAQVQWDRYRCPACRTEYDGDQFKMARSQNLHSSAVERFVSPREAAVATGVPVKTIYSWMERENVAQSADAKTGRPLAWWPDVRDRAVERTQRLKVEKVRRDARKAARAAEAKAEQDDTTTANTAGNETRTEQDETTEEVA